MKIDLKVLTPGSAVELTCRHCNKVLQRGTTVIEVLFDGEGGLLLAAEEQEVQCCGKREGIASVFSSRIDALIKANEIIGRIQLEKSVDFLCLVRTEIRYNGGDKSVGS